MYTGYVGCSHPEISGSKHNVASCTKASTETVYLPLGVWAVMIHIFQKRHGSVCLELRQGAVVVVVRIPAVCQK